MRKTALITGASGGIGKELALLHAKNGDNLVLVARRQHELETLKSEIEEKYKVSVYLLVKDLIQPGASKEVFEATQTLQVNVDYLINNAGFGDHGLFHERDWKISEDMINLNIRALAELTRYYLPSMVERKSGRILNVASTAGFLPGPLSAVYFATKAFVVSFSQALAEEVRGTGVTITALCPGPVDTGFTKASNMEGTTLFEKQKIATPEYTAKIGFRDMMKGRLLSFDNRLMKFGLTRIVPLSPKRLVLRISRKLMEK